MCWNAGVRCTGGPGVYESCDPVNKDVNGLEDVSDDQAVLHPVGRYADLLAGIEAERQQIDPALSVRFALIGGVGADGTVVYQDAVDPEFQDSFGIGPGCTNTSDDEEINGLPPARMRALSSQFGGTLKSVCGDDYAAWFGEIVQPYVDACR